MRTDKYMMAKAWMKQDQAPQAEALDTWNTLEAEFNEERKAMLMASAETDKIKEEINKKFGPGTVKYGSEIKQPEMKTPQAAFEFSQRNPAAEGGRMEYGDGGITEVTQGPNAGKFHLRVPIIGDKDYKRKTYYGTREKLQKILDKREEQKITKSVASNRLTESQLKTVLEWGENAGKGKWSKKKILEEYNNSNGQKRLSIREEETTGKGFSTVKGAVKPLTTEQQKLWDATMDDKVGKWEDYKPVLNEDGSIKTNRRSNWLNDFSRKKEIFDKTKNLLTQDELADYLTKELGEKVSRNKIYGRFGQGKTALATYLDDNVFVDTFGTTEAGTGSDTRGFLRYYKKPTDTQINQIKKQNLIGDIRINSLTKNTLKNVKILDNKYRAIYTSGNLPDLKEVMDATGITGPEIGNAEARLAHMYSGHKYRNNPEGIRVNKKASEGLFDLMSKAQFGSPRKNQLYNLSLDLIDEGLGNEKNTFSNLKAKSRSILRKAGIPLYTNSNPVGFNLDEFAGVTGSARTKNIGVSQFVNILDGKLNQGILSNFQGQLSKARKTVEAAKGTPRYNKVLKEQMEIINTRAIELEKKNKIKLARLERPADINNMSADEVKRLKNIKLGTNENLYQRLVKDAKASGYSIKVPEGSLTIQEFTDPNNKRARELIALVGCPNFKGKQAFAEGGRTGFSEGGDCFDKGQKIINSAQVKSPAAQKNLAKLINGLAKTGTFAKNALKFGVVPEALFVGAESIIRAGGDQTLDEGFKSAIGFYTDWTGKTNFKADARASQNLRNIGLDGTINIEMLNEMRDASEQVKKLESNQKNVLSVYDQSLMGESEQDYKKRSDQQIEDAKKYLSTKYLTDSQKNFYTSQENEAKDIAGTRSPFQKFLGEARNKSENMRYENDPTGMQSDMFTLDPMSAKAKRDSVKNLPLRNQLSGSPGETAFMNLSQLPKGPRQGSEIDDLVTASNAQFKAQGVDTRVNSSVLKAIQDTKQNFKNMTMEEMIQAGLPMEAILGFNQPEVIKQTPMYDYAEGGITGLRSKYEYKK